MPQNSSLPFYTRPHLLNQFEDSALLDELSDKIQALDIIIPTLPVDKAQKYRAEFAKVKVLVHNDIVALAKYFCICWNALTIMNTRETRFFDLLCDDLKPLHEIVYNPQLELEHKTRQLRKLCAPYIPSMLKLVCNCKPMFTLEELDEFEEAGGKQFRFW